MSLLLRLRRTAKDGLWVRALAETNTIILITAKTLICKRNGAGGRTRTPDLLITNQLLYQLSYTSISQRSNIIPKKTIYVK